MDTSQTVRELAFTGAFSWGSLALIGALLLVSIGFLYRREGSGAGNAWAALMFLLRSAVVLLLLWILAGPSIESATRTSHPKSLGVLVDTSGSMFVTDPIVPSRLMVQWAAVDSGNRELQSMSELDSAGAALAMARSAFQRFSHALGEGQSPEHVERLLEHSRKVLEKAQPLLESLDASVLSPEGWEEVDTIRHELGGKYLLHLEDLVGDLSTGRLLLAQNREERLDDVGDWLEESARILLRLSTETAERISAGLDPEGMWRLDPLADRSRIEKVNDLLIRTILPGAEQAKIVGYLFDGASRPFAKSTLSRIALDTDSDTYAFTDLSQALEQVVRDSASEPLEAVILFSDGGHNTGEDPQKIASAISGLPVFTVPIGSLETFRDVVLHHVQAPRAVYLEETITIEGTVDAYECEGERLTIDLLEKDELIDSREIEVTSDAFSETIRFTHKAAKVGMGDFEVRVLEIPEEQVHDNNEGDVRVEVIEAQIKVLLVDYYPRWEHRFLRNLFTRDDRVDLDELQFEPLFSETGRPSTGPGFPQGEEGWNQYGVIILGDIPPKVFDTDLQDRLDHFVSARGGTVILIAGSDWMPGEYRDQPLDRLLPIDLDDPFSPNERGGRLFIASEGRANPTLNLLGDPLRDERFWREFSDRFPLQSLSPYSRLLETSHVLIGVSTEFGDPSSRREERALLSWRQYGKGKVVYLSAPISYHLRHRRGDLLHHRFWGQLVRWTMAGDLGGGSKTVRLSTDKTRYRVGDTVQLIAKLNRTTGEPVTGAVCRASARQDDRTVSGAEFTEDRENPGVYYATLEELPVGPVTVEIAGRQVQALLDEEGRFEPVEMEIVTEPQDSLELRSAKCDLALLSQITEPTGGFLVPPAGLATVLAGLDLAPQISLSIVRDPIWTKWGYLWVFLGCLTLEWILRKWRGLP